MSHITLFMGSSRSAVYAKFRPKPPLALIDKVISYVKEKIPGDLEKAADVGCGTGQSTQILQPYFRHITGFDVSETQLKEAREQSKDMPNITYCVSPAETLPVANQSLQLVTVAQAAHWFSLPEFFKEVHRVLMPNGVCAIYVYLMPLPIPENPAKTKEVQDVLWEFYNGPVRPFWDERRHLVDNKYKEVVMPDEYFTDITNAQRDVTVVETSRDSTLRDYIGYITSWSAFQQMKLKEPELAKKELSRVLEKITDIIGDKNKDPSEIPITMEVSYVLFMGRKKG